MSQLLLLGDEAIAQAAIDAGISGIYAYPGTPSTEIMEYIQATADAEKLDIHHIWSANEKTAMEAALGMSYAGKRSIVCMKHVGLNVAADVFMNMANTGVHGGLVVVSADDPSMHSSQNEQDSRFYGKFAMIPVFEPSNQQEAYNITIAAFNMSEKYKVPVLLRVTTRLAHSRSGVARVAPRAQNPLHLPAEKFQFMLLPAYARVKYAKLLEKQPLFEQEAEQSTYNSFHRGKDKSLGIIACGLAYNYLQENLAAIAFDYSIVKLSQYPLPVKWAEELVNTCERVLVIEEGYPFVEEQLKGLLNRNINVSGRLDSSLPRTGELNPNWVAAALGLPPVNAHQIPKVVVARPPALCNGCSHADLYGALNEALSSFGSDHVFSDIGCYTLGALQPYNSIATCVDMGASVTMAKGAADAGLFPAVAVIGDSTFTHSGMTGLLDAVIENSPITVIISDNSTTGMTGGQTSSATGRLESICRGLGVAPEHIRIMEPLKKNHEQNVALLCEEINYRGTSVIISQRECIQTSVRRKKQENKA